jgi:hypothetical protein
LPAAFAAARFFGAFAGFFVLAVFFATFLRPAFIPLSLPERAHL